MVSLHPTDIRGGRDMWCGRRRGRQARDGGVEGGMEGCERDGRYGLVFGCGREGGWNVRREGGMVKG